MIVQQNLENNLYAKGYEVLFNEGFALVMISPDNSYFKRKTLKKLFDFTTNNFSENQVLINSAPSIHNYLARGLNLNDAKRLSRKRKNNLENNCKVAGFENFYDWDVAMNSSHFQKEYARVKHFYIQDKKFNTMANDLAVSLIKTDDLPMNKAVDFAKEYLLEEIAALGSIPKTHNLRKGYSAIYHQTFPALEYYFSHRYKGKESDVGLLVVK